MLVLGNISFTGVGKENFFPPQLSDLHNNAATRVGLVQSGYHVDMFVDDKDMWNFLTILLMYVMVKLWFWLKYRAYKYQAVTS